MIDLKRLSVNELKNAIWMDNNGMAPIGGYPTEWYRNELKRRGLNPLGYHEEEE